LEAKRQRPYQSVVLGKYSQLKEMPGAPPKNLSFSSLLYADRRKRLSEMQKNMVCVSSIGTKARATRSRPSGVGGGCVQNGRLKLAKRIQVPLVQLAESAIKNANLGIRHPIFGCAIGESRILALRQATVQESEVRRIDFALHGLEIIALPLEAPDAPLFVIQPKRLESRKLGRGLPRPI
jgi:hypothetical protein